MLQIKSKKSSTFLKKRYIYTGIFLLLACISYLFYENYNHYLQTANSSKLFTKMLNKEIERDNKFIYSKSVYRKFLRLVELAECYNKGGDLDIDLDLIHNDFRLKSLFAIITLNKNINTLGYLEKRGSIWLGLVKFLKIINSEIKPKLGEFSFCNCLLIGKTELSEDIINEVADRCTSIIDLNYRID